MEDDAPVIYGLEFQVGPQRPRGAPGLRGEPAGPRFPVRRAGGCAADGAAGPGPAAPPPRARLWPHCPRRPRPGSWRRLWFLPGWCWQLVSVGAAPLPAPRVQAASAPPRPSPALPCVLPGRLQAGTCGAGRGGGARARGLPTAGTSRRGCLVTGSPAGASGPGGWVSESLRCHCPGVGRFIRVSPVLREGAGF